MEPLQPMRLQRRSHKRKWVGHWHTWWGVSSFFLPDTVKRTIMCYQTPKFLVAVQEKKKNLLTFSSKYIICCLYSYTGPVERLLSREISEQQSVLEIVHLHIPFIEGQAYRPVLCTQTNSWREQFSHSPPTEKITCSYQNSRSLFGSFRTD